MPKDEQKTQNKECHSSLLISLAHKIQIVCKLFSDNGIFSVDPSYSLAAGDNRCSCLQFTFASQKLNHRWQRHLRYVSSELVKYDESWE